MKYVDAIEKFLDRKYIGQLAINNNFIIPKSEQATSSGRPDVKDRAQILAYYAKVEGYSLHDRYPSGWREKMHVLRTRRARRVQNNAFNEFLNMKPTQEEMKTYSWINIASSLPPAQDTTL